MSLKQPSENAMEDQTIDTPKAFFHEWEKETLSPYLMGSIPAPGFDVKAE